MHGSFQRSGGSWGHLASPFPSLQRGLVRNLLELEFGKGGLVTRSVGVLEVVMGIPPSEIVLDFLLGIVVTLWGRDQ